MQEITGDLFSHNEAGPDAIAITTNGQVTAKGSLVMGRGCAGEAQARWPQIAHLAGQLVLQYKNRVFLLTHEGFKEGKTGIFLRDKLVPYHLLTFPTKHHWKEPADLELIDRSCQQISQLAEEMGFRSVVIPRPGCGLGQLTWDEVRPICEKWLDERFFLITFS